MSNAARMRAIATAIVLLGPSVACATGVSPAREAGDPAEATAQKAAKKDKHGFPRSIEVLRRSPRPAKATPTDSRPKGGPQTREGVRREEERREEKRQAPQKRSEDRDSGRDKAKKISPRKAATPKVKLRLNGSGLCEYGIFSWDIYHAALYLEKPTRDATKAIDSSQHKVIVLRFCRSLSASQLRSAWDAAFKANAGKQLPKYASGLRKLNKWMKAIKTKEELRFVIRPGRGVEVIDRGTSRGEIRGDDWARMFVRLYLGSAPPDKNLRKGMLRGAAKRS